MTDMSNGELHFFIVEPTPEPEPMPEPTDEPTLEMAMEIVTHYDSNEDDTLNFDEFTTAFNEHCETSEIATEVCEEHTTAEIFDSYKCPDVDGQIDAD